MQILYKDLQHVHLIHNKTVFDIKWKGKLNQDLLSLKCQAKSLQISLANNVCLFLITHYVKCFAPKIQEKFTVITLTTWYCMNEL